ncbi:MAG: sigma-70 family RNA polymerase sigma factor [Acetobacteraceae bacterium]
MAVEDPVWREWMGAAQRGDRKLYAALLSAVLPSLRRAARQRWSRVTPNDVEDVVQERLLALHFARHLYDPGRPFLPFLLGIMRFRGADVMRRSRRTAARSVTIEEADETSALVVAKGGQEGAVEKAALLAAIQRLPAGQRRAIELTKLEELSLKEAAVQSGRSVTAVKVATHRGIRTLRRLMVGSD